MSDQPETYQRISVPEAAELLGVSVATVRRRIHDGSLRAERVQRPQGVVYVVLLGTDHDRSASDQQVGTTARLNQSAQPAPAEAITAMIQAALTPIIAPLVGRLDAQRQTIERQADLLVSQAETIGRQSAEIEALRAAGGRFWPF
jgi:excisionase family DNA binding protein